MRRILVETCRTIKTALNKLYAYGFVKNVYHKNAFLIKKVRRGDCLTVNSKNLYIALKIKQTCNVIVFFSQK